MNDIHRFAIKAVVSILGGILLGGLIFVATFAVQNARAIRALDAAITSDQRELRKLIQTQDKMIRGLGWEK